MDLCDLTFLHSLARRMLLSSQLEGGSWRVPLRGENPEARLPYISARGRPEHELLDQALTPPLRSFNNFWMDKMGN